MPGLIDTVQTDSALGLEFTVFSQKVDLDIDFAGQSLSGTTEIVAQPLSKDLKVFRLNCRQCKVTRATIEGRPAAVSYVDPYDKLTIKPGATTIHQHEYLRSKIEKHVKDPPDPELAITLPPRVTIKELESDPLTVLPRVGSLQRHDSDFAVAETPTGTSAQEQAPKFAPVKIYIEFQVRRFRDGLHFVGFGDDDSRYPHLYTRNNGLPGNVSSIFPCLDNPNSRCTWEISIRCPKNLESAFTLPQADLANGTNGDLGDAKDHHHRADSAMGELSLNLSEADKSLDLSVICSGEMTDDIVDPSDETKKTVSFACLQPVTARHIAFAIGPFEHIDLSEFRELDEDEKLGQSAIRVRGFCLPGRADEVRNTCMPMAKAIDFFTVNFGSFAFGSYKLCFVDDLARDVADAAGLSICSNRLLFPEEIIEHLDTNTRVLVRALAAQYAGIYVIPKGPTDTWVVAGVAGYMTDMFMRKLAGNNEFRFRQKLASDKVFEMDVDRYSLYQLGGQLDVDPSEYDFLALKSALVFFILDRRLTKANGSAGVSRIVTKLFLNAKIGALANGEIETDQFKRLCDKFGHAKLDPFFKQWVYGAGCPKFRVTQRFNKKKLVVEMIITQEQMSRQDKPLLQPSSFMREAKEQVSEAWVPAIQPVFTGPMTIRIHEADGTPYEHIVEIREQQTKFEIPYNTKYKRLKRSKRAKERAIATGGPETTGDNQDDVLLYCLGDTLQSEDDVKEWYLTDWTKDEEDRMGMESYEWIRMDADFEWIGKIQLTMPIYMYVSQLQQDRDVVAQYESLQYIMEQEPHPMMSTILVRTLMDRRYFHGIREHATKGLAACAVPRIRNIGWFHLHKAFQELFCFPDSPMPRANDFSDREHYLLQCAIPIAMAGIRDAQGKVPLEVRRFFIDKIKFNDNSSNEHSDCFYLSTLISCLATSLASSQRTNSYAFNFGDNDDMEDENTEEERIKIEALNEMERYRRIDEWISSYQNTYTITAIDSIERLHKFGVVTNKIPVLMQYIRGHNADNVRLRAYRALVNLKLARKPMVIKLLLDNLCDDQSPHMREQLLGVFGEALGSIAIGDEEAEKPPPPKMDIDSGLVLEQEAPTDNKQFEIARKNLPEVALAALKSAVAEDDTFKSALWKAILSPKLALCEMVDLLDIAALLFEPSNNLIVTLALPPTYRVEHLGKAKLRFFKGNSFRSRPSEFAGLGLQDWNLVQQHAMNYTGPISKEVTEHQAQVKNLANEEKRKHDQRLELEAQLAALQRAEQLKAQKKASSAMSPPPVPAPAEAGTVKLSLKRKPSVDVGRAASPKAPKIQKTTNGSAVSSPVVARSPSAIPSAKRSATPSRASAPAIKLAKPKPVSRWSRMVQLKTPGPLGQRVQEILSKPPARRGSDSASRTGSQTPAPTTAQSPPPNAQHGSSPAAAAAPFPSSVGWNMGSFRNYSSPSSASPAQAALARVKTEDLETGGTLATPASGISPMNMTFSRPTASVNGGSSAKASPAPESVASEQDGRKDDSVLHDGAPPKPTRKLTLKLGPKARQLNLS